MKIIQNLSLSLLLSYSCMLFTAAFEGKLYIQNDHPVFQFECKYTVDGEGRGPIAIYDNKPIPLGFIQNITDIQITRYGKYAGAGAQYHPLSDQLAECKRRPDQNCILHIEASITGWTVKAHSGETPQATEAAVEAPIDYFSKAKSYAQKAEPRHVLGLGAPYTTRQVDEQQKRLREQIQHSELGIAMREQVLKILDAATLFAKQLLASPDQATKILLAFHGKLHPELVEQGRKIACDLFTGERIPRLDQGAYLNAIIDLMWFYYDMAIDKNQAFSEGTFVLQDQGNRIYDFLMKYVKMVNPKDINPVAIPPSYQFAYPRFSTHFKDEQDKYGQYGIDIRFTLLSPQFLLPAQKSHLLFGKINKDLIYIKMENYGTCPDQFPQHAKQTGEAQARKMLPTLDSYLKEYFPQRILDWAKNYVGTDDDPNYRKEHIPQQVLQIAIQILRSSHLPDAQLQPIIDRFTRQGIHAIFDEISNAKSPLPQAQKEALQNILVTLQVNQGLDHEDMRRGREVIIMNPDLTVRCM